MSTIRNVAIATISVWICACSDGGAGTAADAAAADTTAHETSQGDAATDDTVQADTSQDDTAPNDTASNDTATIDTAPQDAADSDAATDASSNDTAGGDPWACPVAPEPACGGTLAGTTWEIIDFCPEDPVAAGALFEHPFSDLAACKPPGGTVSGKLVDTGTISFTATEMKTDIGGYAATTYTFSTACLAAAKPGIEAATACSSMSKADLMSCSFDATADAGAGRCTCDAKVPKEGGPGAMAYSVEGGDTIKTAEFQAAYCIDGDRLLMDVKPHIVSWRWWLLKRKD